MPHCVCPSVSLNITESSSSPPPQLSPTYIIYWTSVLHWLGPQSCTDYWLGPQSCTDLVLSPVLTWTSVLYWLGPQSCTDLDFSPVLTWTSVLHWLRPFSPLLTWTLLKTFDICGLKPDREWKCSKVKLFWIILLNTIKISNLYLNYITTKYSYK